MGRWRVIDGGIVRDDIEELDTKLRCSLETADVIVTSGGVSMGEADLLKR